MIKLCKNEQKYLEVSSFFAGVEVEICDCNVNHFYLSAHQI